MDEDWTPECTDGQRVSRATAQQAAETKPSHLYLGYTRKLNFKIFKLKTVQTTISYTFQTNFIVKPLSLIVRLRSLTADGHFLFVSP